MNYRSVGKEIAEDLKVLSPSPWNYNVVLDTDSQRCFQTQTPKKLQKKQKNISPNKCSYAREKCLFKIFSCWGKDHNNRGYNGQNSTETQCRAFLVSESRCRSFSVLESWCCGILSFRRILTLMISQCHQDFPLQ